MAIHLCNKTKSISSVLFNVAINVLCRKIAVKTRKLLKITFTSNRIQTCKMPASNIKYSEKYEDEEFEYRHVVLPPDLSRLVPQSHLMTETEWRNLGVQQSPNWVHYMIHRPEPHILLFRRKKTRDD